MPTEADWSLSTGAREPRNDAGSTVGELVIAHLETRILQQLADVLRTFEFPSGRIHRFDLDKLTGDFERCLLRSHTFAPSGRPLNRRFAKGRQVSWVAQVSVICRKPRLSTRSCWPGWINVVEDGSSMISGPDAVKSGGSNSRSRTTASCLPSSGNSMMRWPFLAACAERPSALIRPSWGRGTRSMAVRRKVTNSTGLSGR